MRLGAMVNGYPLDCPVLGIDEGGWHIACQGEISMRKILSGLFDSSLLEPPPHFCCVGPNDPSERRSEEIAAYNALSGGSGFASQNHSGFKFDSDKHRGETSDGSRRGETGRSPEVRAHTHDEPVPDGS